MLADVFYLISKKRFVRLDFSFGLLSSIRDTYFDIMNSFHLSQFLPFNNRIKIFQLKGRKILDSVFSSIVYNERIFLTPSFNVKVVHSNSKIFINNEEIKDDQDYYFSTPQIALKCLNLGKLKAVLSSLLCKIVIPMFFKEGEVFSHFSNWICSPV